MPRDYETFRHVNHPNDATCLPIAGEPTLSSVLNRESIYQTPRCQQGKSGCMASDRGFDGYLQGVKIAPRRALFIDDEKAALDVPFEDPVPHYQGPAFTEGVPEANPLSCRQGRVRMGCAEAVRAVVLQAAPKLPGVRGVQHKPNLALR